MCPSHAIRRIMCMYCLVDIDRISFSTEANGTEIVQHCHRMAWMQRRYSKRCDILISFVHKKMGHHECEKAINFHVKEAVVESSPPSANKSNESAASEPPSSSPRGGALDLYAIACIWVSVEGESFSSSSQHPPANDIALQAHPCGRTEESVRIGRS